MFLVTGATGFVGQYVLRALHERGIPFHAASRSAHEDFIPVGEINGSTDWRAALAGVDTVIHLAAYNQNILAGGRESLEEMRAVNIDGTVRLAEQCVAYGVKRFVFISTVKVNGESSELGHPFTAHSHPLPESDYGVSKLEAENCVRQIADGSGMEFVIIRPPLVYGQGAKGSFRALVKLVRSGVPLPFRSIHNRRSVIHVENLADLIVTASTSATANGKILMAADGVAPSTAEFIRKIAAANGRRALLLPLPAPFLQAIGALTGKSEIVGRLVDSLEVDAVETSDILGWRPLFSTDEGLRRSI